VPLTRYQGPRTVRDVAISLLGPLQVDGDGALAHRDRVVLAALAMRSGDVLSAERLADALWGECPPKSWPKIVQGCVLRLRRTLGRESVVTTTGGYRLQLRDEDIDVRRFEHLIARGHMLGRDGEHRRAATAYDQALQLWRGPALTDLEEWPDGRSESLRLEELRHGTQEALIDARLAGGEDCVADATALVAAAPLRERRWSLLALALYRSGRQGDALSALRRARESLRDELGLDPAPEMVELERAILNHDPTLDTAALATAASEACPYKGLLAYDRNDADWFFGRDTEIEDCLRVLARSSVLAVVGPSGCGKSSLVRAGIAPALDRTGSTSLVMTPGIDPLLALAATMSSAGRERVLVVDQLEELFTAGHSTGVVEQFLDQLAHLAGNEMRVVVVLRADRVSGLSESPAFARAVEQGLHLVTGMTTTEMRDAIEGPSRMAGLRLEPGLVEVLLREVEDEPGALPLLSHALAETWERREADELTLDGYRATGGIRSAVAQTAEQLFTSLPARQQAGVRAILLRVMGLSPDGDPVVNRAPLSLFSADGERSRLVDLLADARLLTKDDRSVTVAHEAVIRAWPRLRSWLDEDIEGQRTLRHLTTAAADWQASGRPASELYRGARLDAALDWRRRSRPELTPVESDFLDAATGQAQAEQAAREQQARQRIRQNRRLRAALVGTALGLVLAVLAGSVAVQRSRDEARTAGSAQVERLVAQSIALRATRRDLAALLALEAYRLRPDASTRGALLGVFTASPGFLGYRATGRAGDTENQVPLTAGHLLRDGRTLLASGTDGVVRAIDLGGGDAVRRFPSPRITALGSLMDLSRDGRTVAEVAWNGPAGSRRRSVVLEVFDVASRSRRLPGTELPLNVGAVAVSPTGRYVAVSGDDDGRVLIYDTAISRLPDIRGLGLAPVSGVVELPVASRPRLSRFTAQPESPVGARDTAGLAFRRDGMLVAGSLSGIVRIVDPKDGRMVRRLAGAPALTSNNTVAVSPDGSVLLTAGASGLVRWDLATGRPAWVSDLGEGSCSRVVVVKASRSILCGGQFGQVLGLDLDSGRPTGARFDMQSGRVSALTLSPDGRTLVELSDSQPVVARWRLDGSGPITRRLDVDAAPSQFNADGRRLLVTGRGSRREIGGDIWPERLVVDAGTGVVVDRLRGYYQAAWTTKPTQLALWGDYGVVSVIDLADHRRVIALQGGVGSAVTATAAAGGRFLLACEYRGYFGDACEAWDLRTGHPVFGRLVPAGVGGSISGDGRIVTWSGDDEFATYDTRLGKRVATRRDVTRGAVSPTGIVVGSTDAGRLSFYDARTLRPVGDPLPGAPGPVEQFEFTRDGALLATRGGDGAVRLIDVARRVEIGEPIRLTGTSNPTIALRPDGAELAVPDVHGIVIWDLRPGHWAAAACDVAGRSLTRAESDSYLAGLDGHRPTCPATAVPR
jgi:DNA-binding SARP family transcriptional activator/WD40 repeat protein